MGRPAARPSLPPLMRASHAAAAAAVHGSAIRSSGAQLPAPWRRCGCASGRARTLPKVSACCRSCERAGKWVQPWDVQRMWAAAWAVVRLAAVRGVAGASRRPPRRVPPRWGAGFAACGGTIGAPCETGSASATVVVASLISFAPASGARRTHVRGHRVSSSHATRLPIIICYHPSQIPRANPVTRWH